jgi:hypothetical protein
MFIFFLQARVTSNRYVVYYISSSAEIQWEVGKLQQLHKIMCQYFPNLCMQTTN